VRRAYVEKDTGIGVIWKKTRGLDVKGKVDSKIYSKPGTGMKYWWRSGAR
jgi:hypothetical protein